MDQVHIQALPDETRARYRELEKTFGTPGWKMITEWAQAQADQLTDRIADAKTWEENRVLFGMRLVMRLMASYDVSTEAEFRSIADAQLEATAVEDEQEYE